MFILLLSMYIAHSMFYLNMYLLLKFRSKGRQIHDGLCWEIYLEVKNPLAFNRKLGFKIYICHFWMSNDNNISTIDEGA